MLKTQHSPRIEVALWALLDATEIVSIHTTETDALAAQEAHLFTVAAGSRQHQQAVQIVPLTAVESPASPPPNAHPRSRR